MLACNKSVSCRKEEKEVLYVHIYSLADSFFLCWPLALAALVLYPLVWIFLLPFRLIGLTVEGVFAFLKAVIMLPARIAGMK